MYITGPDVVRQVTHEDVTHEDLGGAQVHYTKTGVAQFMRKATRSASRKCAASYAFLPSNNAEDPPMAEPSDDRRTAVCEEHANRHPGRLQQALRRTQGDRADHRRRRLHGGARRLGQEHRRGLARMGGRVVGIVANNPGYVAGVLDVDSSRKGARFVRFCDAFNIPIVTLVDVPGYMPGTGQEYAGIIIHGAKLLYAYAEATVPRVTIILRKDFGGAYLVMGSKHLRADINLAWPGAEIAVTGPDAAANIIFRREIEAAIRPGHPPQGADRRLQGALRQPLHRGLPRLRRRRDRPAPDARQDHPRAGDAGEQDRHKPPAETRQHPSIRGYQPGMAVERARVRLLAGMAVCGLLMIVMSFLPWLRFHSQWHFEGGTSEPGQRHPQRRRTPAAGATRIRWTATIYRRSTAGAAVRSASATVT